MKRMLAIAAVLALSGTAAKAQDGWGWSTIIPSVTGTDVLGTHLREVTRPEPRTASPSPRPAPRPDAPTASAGSLTYAVSTERRAANIERFLDQRRASQPAAIEALAPALRDPDLIPNMGRQIGRYGLRVDNVAHAYAVWWAAAWSAVHQDTSDPSPAAGRAIRIQAEQAFASLPAITGADDTLKQAFAEELLLQALLITTATEQAASNPEQARAVSRMASQNARAQGLDLESLDLTDEGFVARN
jgi:hypothetical protein